MTQRTFGRGYPGVMTNDIREGSFEVSGDAGSDGRPAELPVVGRHAPAPELMGYVQRAGLSSSEAAARHVHKFGQQRQPLVHGQMLSVLHIATGRGLLQTAAVEELRRYAGKHLQYRRDSDDGNERPGGGGGWGEDDERVQGGGEGGPLNRQGRMAAAGGVVGGGLEQGVGQEMGCAGDSMHEMRWCRQERSAGPVRIPGSVERAQAMEDCKGSAGRFGGEARQAAAAEQMQMQQLEVRRPPQGAESGKRQLPGGGEWEPDAEPAWKLPRSFHQQQDAGAVRKKPRADGLEAAPRGSLRQERAQGGGVGGEERSGGQGVGGAAPEGGLLDENKQLEQQRRGAGENEVRATVGVAAAEAQWGGGQGGGTSELAVAAEGSAAGAEGADASRCASSGAPARAEPGDSKAEGGEGGKGALLEVQEMLCPNCGRHFALQSESGLPPAAAAETGLQGRPDRCPFCDQLINWEAELQTSGWAQCDRCDTWRVQPMEVVDSLKDDEPWTCAMMYPGASCSSTANRSEQQKCVFIPPHRRWDDDGCGGVAAAAAAIVAEGLVKEGPGRGGRREQKQPAENLVGVLKERLVHGLKRILGQSARAGALGVRADDGAASVAADATQFNTSSLPPQRLQQGEVDGGAEATPMWQAAANAPPLADAAQRPSAQTSSAEGAETEKPQVQPREGAPAAGKWTFCAACGAAVELRAKAGGLEDGGGVAERPACSCGQSVCPQQHEPVQQHPHQQLPDATEPSWPLAEAAEKLVAESCADLLLPKVVEDHGLHRVRAARRVAADAVRQASHELGLSPVGGRAPRHLQLRPGHEPGSVYDTKLSNRWLTQQGNQPQAVGLRLQLQGRRTAKASSRMLEYVPGRDRVVEADALAQGLHLYDVSKGKHVLAVVAAPLQARGSMAMLIERGLQLFAAGKLKPAEDGRVSAGPIDLSAYIAQDETKLRIRQALEKRARRLQEKGQELPEGSLQRMLCHVVHVSADQRKVYIGEEHDRTCNGGSIMGFCKSWKSCPIRSWSGGFKVIDQPGHQPNMLVASKLSKLLEAEQVQFLRGVEAVWNVFASHPETRQAAQKMLLFMESHPIQSLSRLGRSGWNAYSFNIDYRTGCHIDGKNVPGSYSALLIMETVGEPFCGGYYMLPQYQLALDVRPGLVLFHRSGDQLVGLHGNSGLHLPSPTSHRIAIVLYQTRLLSAKKFSQALPQAVQDAAAPPRAPSETEDGTIVAGTSVPGDPGVGPRADSGIGHLATGCRLDVGTDADDVAGERMDADDAAGEDSPAADGL